MSEQIVRSLERRYFLWDKPKNVAQRRCSFRYFSEFLGFQREEWQRAVGSILDLEDHEGNTRLLGFRRWLIRRQPRGGRQIFYHVRPFLAFASKEGVLGWKVRTRHEDEAEKRWKSCTPPYRKALRAWLESLRVRNFSTHSIKGHRSKLLRLGSYLALKNVKGLAVRPGLAEKWIAQFRNRHVSDNMARAYVQSGYRFYKWLVAVGLAEQNPFEGHPRFRIPKRSPRHVPEDQILKLLRAPHPPRERAILEVLYASGCRVGELTSLNLGAVSFKDRTVRCAGKGGRERLILLNRAAVRAIRAYLPIREKALRHAGSEAEPALFVTFVGRRLSAAHVSGLIQAAVERARLDVPVTAHVIRHSLATHLLNRGADLESIQAILGHTDIRSTVIYAHLCQPRMRRDFLRYVPRPRILRGRTSGV